MSASLTAEAKRAAYALGFDLVAVGAAEALEQDRERYQSWVSQGHAAGMAYMERPLPRRWDPRDLLPEARSVVTLAVNFFSASPKAESRRGYGRVARYAWGKDYHEVVRERLELWTESLRGIAGSSVRTKILVDSSPLLERAFARSSGLGFAGKNTLLISRKLGSFIFLSEVLTDLELEPDAWTPAVPAGKDECGSCRECLADCPTGALVAPRTLDARKCISYWTIENRGPIPEAMRPQIGDWIFGCDVCQEVCPYTGLSKDTAWKEFRPESGAGPHLALDEILALGEADFKKRFAGTPILRTKRAGLVRNACVVAANQKLTEVLPLLRKLAEEEPDPVVREHAGWARRTLEG
jgi:epoxyqueuosine reductase